MSRRQTSLFPEYVDTGAVFDGPYRYRLWRRWTETSSPRVALWIMLNPSTADAHVLDPTIRRCVAFSKAWGCDGLEVCNLFAWKSTDPDGMLRADDPVGPGNDDAIQKAAEISTFIVAAWGTLGTHRDRDSQVRKLIRNVDRSVQCLGRTQDGHPRHPLYVPGRTELEVL